MLLWRPQENTLAENAQWSLLRALEWSNWPLFITQPIAPILFIFYPWWTVLLGVVLLDWMWALIRHKFVSPFLAEVGLWFVKLKWVVCPVVCIYFLYQHIYFVSVLSLLYPLVNVLLMDLAPRGGQIGTLQSSFMTSMGYRNGEGVTEDDTRLAASLREAAEQGDAEAQFNLGYLYDKGQGVPEDYAQAAFWYRKAAEQGVAEAQYNLGFLYYKGQGLPQDYTQAAFWVRKAAEQGVAVAQNNLAGLYRDGQGVSKDYVQAASWYRKAAEQGVAEAQSNLGAAYRFGQGMPRDYAQAVFWSRKAAEQGDAMAQAGLGILYGAGQGVPQDFAEAYFWFDLAAAGKLNTSDSRQVAKYRDEAASILTPAVLAREQERVRKWFEAHQAKPQ